MKNISRRDRMKQVERDRAVGNLLEFALFVVVLSLTMILILSIIL